ncbi:MAG: VWA domain-containing protein [Eubacteriales bacterium]
MNIEIVRPYLLVVLPMFILMIILSYKYLARIRKKGSFLLFIRGLIITLLILALCGINISWQKKNTTNIFVLDLSSSAKHFQNDGEDFIREAFKIMPKGHQGGVLVFGEDVLVDRFVSSSNKYLEATSNPIESSTNIQNALTSALALLPENQAKRVILISDGEENEGEAEKLITSFQQQKVDFKVVKVNRKEQEEVYVDNLIVPERIHYGESFNIVANIKSNIKTKADLTLYSGRNVKGTKTVDVQKGDNSFVFKDTGEESGLKNYRVVIEPYIDTEVKNNEYITYTQVQSKPQILLIEGGEGEGNELETIIKASNLDYKKVNTVGTPRTLGEMTEYKSIILANVHADDLNESFKSNLETYVKDYAGGLIVSGGENAFALGGYKDTSIEKVLPVDMELKGEKEIPEMSLIMAIDHSGSMSDGNGYINK